MKLAMTPRGIELVVLLVETVCGSHFMGAYMSWAPASNNTFYDCGRDLRIYEGLYYGSSWYSPGGSWSLLATVDLSVRSTGKINSSPTVNVPPVLYWKAGCLHNFTLPVLDVDGDVIKCRRAVGSLECGGVCNSFPGLVLHEETCTISYSASSTIGNYVAALQIEDFVSRTSSTPLSSVPLQFLVKTYTGTAGCSDQSVLVYPTPETSTQYTLDIGQTLHIDIKAKGPHSFHRIVTQSAVRLIRSKEVKSSNSSWNYIEMNVTLTAHSNESGKVHNLCFYARDNIGVTSETRCVTIQVSDIDNCASFPCKNGGACLDDINSYTCVCIPGYIGRNCSVDVNECQSNPCQNGASCIDKINGYLCSCGPGFVGTNCDIDVNECQSKPCQNGASCTDKINGYLCTCVPGYSGQSCDIDNDECNSSPCKNGGTCLDRLNSYKCSCAAGYTGVNCKTEINECISSPCRNKAYCSDDLNGFRCFCLEGYSGNNCETELDECISNPCQFGGNCSDRINGYVCSCVAGYAGINCETDIDNQHESMPFLLTIIVGAVLGATVLILVVFAAYRLFADKTRKISKAHSSQENPKKGKTKTKRENAFVNKSNENEIKLSEEEIYVYKESAIVNRSSGKENIMSDEETYVNMPPVLRNYDKPEESELRNYDKPEKNELRNYDIPEESELRNYDIPEEEYADRDACDRIESRIYETIY